MQTSPRIILLVEAARGSDPALLSRVARHFVLALITNLATSGAEATTRPAITPDLGTRSDEYVYHPYKKSGQVGDRGPLCWTAWAPSIARRPITCAQSADRTAQKSRPEADAELCHSSDRTSGQHPPCPSSCREEEEDDGNGYCREGSARRFMLSSFHCGLRPSSDSGSLGVSSAETSLTVKSA